MSDYPTPSEYQEALQHPEAAFVDDQLKRATPRSGPLGLPRPTTGAFAAVFPMTTPEGATYAAKCFLTEVEDQQARYRAIADQLAEADLPYTVGFDYQPEGIRVGGRAFPLLKMEWAEGVPLNHFVEAHLDAPDVLAALAEAWADMLARLEDAAFAHGDLQHGNVLVEESKTRVPRLRLVDYDTAFVPALAGRKSAEVGHRNYQHPDRTEADFGLHLDRFPGLAVHVALRALALRPDRRGRSILGERPGLWKKYDTGENLLFRAGDFYDPGASSLFTALSEAEEIQDEVEALRAACHHAPEDVPPLADLRSGAAEIDAMPVGKTRRPRQPSREGMAHWFAPALAAGAAGVFALAAAGLWFAALLVVLMGTAAGAGAAARDYRRQPVVRRRRRLRQEAARFGERVENLRREEESLQKQRKAVLARREERRTERLAEVREEALRDCLKHHFVGEVRAVEGLSHKTVVRLKADGIRTAYEASPEALAGVTKLGEKSKARLRMWRASLAERYAEDVPDALSPAEKRRLKRFTERRLEQIDAEMARTRRKREAQSAERAEALPELSAGRYVRYLLRLEDALPAPEEAPTPKPAPPETEPRASEPPTPPAASNEPEAEPGGQSWYEQRGEP